MANRCAAALGLEVPMVVDGIDDAVNMAYSAWPERIYVLKADGTIHYRSELGPMGFKPREASIALAGLLGRTAPDAGDEEEVAADGVDDGFSGLWTGSGRGPVMEGEIPVRLRVALGADGVVGGKIEVTDNRYAMPLLDARYDADTGKLTAAVPMRGGRARLDGKVVEQAITGSLAAPGGRELLAFDVKRARKGPALEPGPEDPAGTWSGAATSRDPALFGRAVELVLAEASEGKIAGTLTVGTVKATIQRGRYDARTGALALEARTEDGKPMSLAATLAAGKAVGSVTMQPALLVAFELTRK